MAPDHQTEGANEAPDLEKQEVRFALVMTGGVSLAVWMGGAAYEFYRMLRRSDEAKHRIYEGLLDLTSSKACVDVIAGTSAGGLNGVLLASALLAGTEVDDFKTLRDTWMDTGDIVNLLRDSSDRSATSLLKGDGYFLPSIHGVIERLTKDNREWASRDEPLDLVVPATLLTPEVNCLSDDYGHQFTETDYHAYFRFGWGEDAYYPSPNKRSIEKLALAARTSASFPFAFEPSFVPGGKAKKSLGENVSTTRSRFMVDGGILDNKPLGHALDVIATRRASGTVRRVLAYFAPSVESEKEHPADKRRDPPPLASVLSAAVISIRANETISADLRRLREHNERARDQERRRALIITGSDAGNIAVTADKLINTQMRLHAYGAARILVRRLDRRLSEALAESDRERLIDALASKRVNILKERGDADRGRDIGDPLSVDVVETLLSDIEGEATPEATLNRLYGEVRPKDKQELWPWGLYAVQYATETATSIVRRCMLAVPPTGDNLELLGRLAYTKKQLHFLRLTIIRLKDLDRVFWDSELDRLARDGLDDNLEQWATECFDNWPEPRSERDKTSDSTWGQSFQRLREHAKLEGDLKPISLSEAIAYNTAALLSTALADCATAIKRSDASVGTMENLSAEVRYFTAKDVIPAERTIEVLRRMVSVFIVQSSFNVLTVSEDAVEFLLVSADTQSPLGGSRAAGDKLAGMQLANFAGFIKRSWRANDWMWGRLDAADRIIHALCDPVRIKRSSPDAATAWMAIENMIASIWDHCDKAQRDRARAEIDRLYAPGPIPSQLPETAKLLSEAQQRLIAAEELPLVAAAIAASERDEKASAAGAALRFAKAVTDTAPDKLAAEAKVLLDKMRIGEEQWRGEAGSDHFTRVTSHATMVFANLASNPKTNLSMMGRAVDKVQSGITALFLLAQLTVRRSRTTFALTFLAMLAAGLVLVFQYGPALDDLRPAQLLVTIAWLTVVAVAILLLFYRYGVAALTVLVLGGLVVTAIIAGRQEVVDALDWCCATDPRVTWAETAAAVGFSAAGLTALSDRGRSSGWWALGAVLGFLAGIAAPVLADSQIVTGLWAAVLGGSIVVAVESRAIPTIAKRTLALAVISALATWGVLWLLALLVAALEPDTGFWAEQLDDLHERREAWTVALVPLFVTIVAFLRFGKPFSQTKAGQTWRRWFGYA